jgi:hypothetical protein
MKVKLNIVVEFQVNDEANKVGSCEKVVWAEFYGTFSFPSLPRKGELLLLWPLDKKGEMAKLDVIDIHHVLHPKFDEGVFTPHVFAEYVISCGGEELHQEIEGAECQIEHISSWLVQNGFSISKSASYSVRC